MPNARSERADLALGSGRMDRIPETVVTLLLLALGLAAAWLLLWLGGWV